MASRLLSWVKFVISLGHLVRPPREFNDGQILYEPEALELLFILYEPEALELLFILYEPEASATDK